MQNVKIYVSRMEWTLDPDDAPLEPPRRVWVTVDYKTDDGRSASHDFAFFVSGRLTDLAAIEQEAYRQLREHLTALLGMLP